MLQSKGVTQLHKIIFFVFFPFDPLLLTSKISNSEVSVAELFGGLEEEPLADRWKVFVHSADRLDHLVRQQTQTICSVHAEPRRGKLMACELKSAGSDHTKTVTLLWRVEHLHALSSHLQFNLYGTPTLYLNVAF